MVLYPTKLCDEDYVHIGMIIKHIRETRQITQTKISDLANLSPSTINRLESGFPFKYSEEREDSFNKYLSALGSPEIHRPLRDHQTNILKKLFRSSTQEHIEEAQRLLAGISFYDILDDKRHPEFTELIQKLEVLNRPAFILDPLWFIHALNDSALGLFGLDHQNKFLNKWEAWHVIATKFYPDSPIRNAHYNRGVFFPPVIDQLFWDEDASRYLFTIQMRLLLCKLHKLSKDNDFNFTDWWDGALSFTLDYPKEHLNRIIRYNSHTITIEAETILRKEVRLFPGCVIPFKLIMWKPIEEDETVEKILNSLGGLPLSTNIFYADDYETVNHDFHVNTWPELQELLT